MGQSPSTSKRMGRTRSKELSASDLADSMANTTISSQSRPDGPSSPVASPGASPSVDPNGNGFSTPARMSARRSTPGKGKEDRNGSISSFTSASGGAARSNIQPLNQQNFIDTASSSIRSPQSASYTPSAPSGSSDNLGAASLPAIPTTSTILASSPSPNNFRTSILGSSPPPPSAIHAAPGRPPSPSPAPSGGSSFHNRDSNASLSPGAALSTTISRSSTGGSASGQVLDVDNMIVILLEAGYSGKVTKSPPLKNAEIASVCAAAREVFLSQPTLIELSPPVKIVGDVHGQVST